MTVFSDGQLAALARGAGVLHTNGVAWAVAICLAESGGNPAKISPPNSDGSVDRGLWQINNRAHPDVTDAQALSPTGNATAMARISLGGHSWGAWSTYWADPVHRRGPGQGAAAHFLPRGIAAASGTPVPAPSGPTTAAAGADWTDTARGLADGLNPGLGLIDGVLGGAGGLKDSAGALAGIARGIAAALAYVAKTAAWVSKPHNWVRIVYVIGGFAAVLAGLAILESSTKAGQTLNTHAAGLAAHAARAGEVAAA